MSIYTIVQYETVESGIRKIRTRFMRIVVDDVDRNGFAFVRLKGDGSIAIDLTMAKDS